MDEIDDFILLEPDDENDTPHIKPSTTSHLRLSADSLKHLDAALKEINTLLYEDVIELWKVYGEC